jgi:hypothetical protein
MAERSDAPLADEPQPGAIPNDVPSGLPEGVEESVPLGGDKPADPEGEGETPRGEQAQPGINQDEPDVSG